MLGKVDRAKSALTGDSFSYKPLPSGKYVFSYGTTTHYTITCDGAPFSVGIAEYAGTCTKTGPRTYAFTSLTNGKLTDKDTVTISADGTTYSDAGTHYRPDGSTSHDVSTFARAGSGTGIGGTWKTAKVSSNSPYTLTFASTPAGLAMSNPDYKWKVVLKGDKTYSDNTIKVSDDGKTLSWTSQAPGNTATTTVYDKE